MRYVELNTFVKISKNLATGGQAKRMIRGGAVRVNGETDTRNKRKLVPGDKIEIAGQIFTVDESHAKKTTAK